MKYARIVDGIVAELGEFPSPPVMHPSLVWVADPAGTAREGWTHEAAGFAAPIPSVEQARVARRSAVEQQFNQRLAAGITWDGKSYQVAGEARANIADMGTLAGLTLVPGSGASMPPSYEGWIATDNTITPMTPSQLVVFASFVAAFWSGAIVRRRVLKTAIQQAASVAAVEAIDVTTGWPPAEGSSA